MDYIDLLRNAGLGIAVVSVVGWFLVYKVWPFYCKQVIANAEDRKSLHKDFQEALARRDLVNDRILTSLQELTVEIRSRRRV